MVKNVKTMKLWIGYMNPEIEGGNSFGVEIQEKTLLLVQAVEASV